MTLRELLGSVDSEQYSDSPLFQVLRETKPEYGANRRIEVRLVNGDIVITNAHIGSLGDIITYPIDVPPEVQLLDAILKELAYEGFGDGEQADFWAEMTDLQKAKIIR